ncbi:protease Do-like protein 5, chloroplastic [Tanacetum coccineum]|uniref:Protease Do-like protein 5, chloroplastic n=1 Tax=Tanacetum coccineum TaxID=301880 RepID=A0ABQ5FM94_9ASTR
MKDNEVWDLVDLPSNGKTIGSKWLFKKKTDMDDIRAIKILIAIDAFYDYEIWQMDVKTAFLNGHLFEEVYMVQPECFVNPKFPNRVTNYHVVEKLATNQNGRQRCKVFLVNKNGNNLSRNGKIIGVDPSSDLAVLKVDVEGIEVKLVDMGNARKLNVGQSCYAIGNPYGYENTLTTGIVRNSGGPLLDSHGHVIGVNTATFTRKGNGMSSGVNFAIPIDTVVQTVPYLIVYETAYRDRF